MRQSSSNKRNIQTLGDVFISLVLCVWADKRGTKYIPKLVKTTANITDLEGSTGDQNWSFIFTNLFNFWLLLKILCHMCASFSFFFFSLINTNKQINKNDFLDILLVKYTYPYNFYSGSSGSTIFHKYMIIGTLIILTVKSYLRVICFISMINCHWFGSAYLNELKTKNE